MFFAFGSDRKRIRTLRLVQPYRLVFNCFAKPENGLFPVYRLEEDGSVLKEGGVRLTVKALRTRSYKNKAEA